MKLYPLIAATLVLAAASCTKDFDGTIACASDLNCPTGYHCGTGGKCQKGEASVTVQWVSPADGTLMRGAQTFSVKVSHPDGVSSVKLMAGTTQIAVINTPADTGKGGLVQVDLTNVDTSQAPDGNTTLSAVGASSKGATGNGDRAFHLDNHESAPTFTTSNPQTPNNSNGTTFVLKGTADVNQFLAPSNVYIFSGDSTCNNGQIAGAIASGTASSFVEPGFILPVVFDSATTYFAMAIDSLGNTSACSAGFTFINDRVESTPFFASGAVASGNRPNGPFLVGTASTNLSPSTVSIFAAPDCTGTPVATGPATAFVTTGIQVPLVANATTTYTVQSADVLGNVSACSNTVANGSVASTNAQNCADVPALRSAQLFPTPVMQGCGGQVTYDNRATLCAAGCRVATADEWVTNFGGAAPAHHYWVDEALTFSNAGGACGPAGCNTNNCYASRANTSPLELSCGTGRAMHVCTGTGAFNGADPEGNTCTWTACGYNSITPKQFFGGCSSPGDLTAGALCVCTPKQWFVDAANGNDANTGAVANPVKTLTKGLTLPQAGDTVFVAPGVYDTANGETFPITVPSGVIVIGDETNRGGGGTPTRIGTAGANLAQVVVLKDNSTFAGFTVTGALGATPVVKLGGANVTVRGNTISAAGSFGLEVSGGSGYRALMNTMTGNSIGFLARNTVTSGKVENSTMTGNAFGIDFEIGGGDAGGGASGSVGNNTLSCNTSTDFWTNQAGMTANFNKWDHNPPTANCAGCDITGSPSTANPQLASPVCP